MKTFIVLLLAACALASVQGRALQQAAAALAAVPTLSTFNQAVTVS
jgi:hypothetical protein